MNAEVALKAETDVAQAQAYETTAVVLWFNPIRGYGFLEDDKTKEKLFVHHSNILMSGFKYLNDGENVECLAVPTEKGWNGMNVKVIEE